MNLVEKFLKYVSFETTSYEVKEDRASSDLEYLLSEEMKKELEELGGQDIYINKFGTVYAYFPGEIEREPLALIAHMDTSSQASGKDVKPRIIKNYDGKDIELSKGIVMSTKDFPSLKDVKGDDLIVTDGTTLLGGDDKAGIAIIMQALEDIIKSNKKHIPLEVIFTTDEEIGVGASHIDVDRLKSKYGYTVDGGDIKNINYENFNASSMTVTVKGRSIHPGSAKDKMINALNVAIDFHNSLPKYMRPEDTELREGFYHLLSLNGSEDEAKALYIIRDHDFNKLEFMEDYAKLAAKRINDSYGSEIIKVETKLSYKNMKEIIDKHYEIVEQIVSIYKELGYEYQFEAVRGGTDGAELTVFNNFPCPNLGTGDFNCHGRFEYVSINQMEKGVNIIKKLIQ